MIKGWIKLHRKILESDIWYNQMEFRMFVFLILKCNYGENIRIGDLIIERGQYLTSYRKLQEHLGFIENNGLKMCSLSTIKNCLNKLSKKKMINFKAVELGTLITIEKYNEYQAFFDFEDGAGNAKKTPTKHQRNNNKEYKEVKEIYNKESNPFLYSLKLHTEILKNDSKSKTPNFQKWAADFDKLNRIDGRDWTEIENVLIWCQNNDFWKSNILSARKFRIKYQTLKLQMEKDKNKKTTKKPYTETGMKALVKMNHGSEKDFIKCYDNQNNIWYWHKQDGDLPEHLKKETDKIIAKIDLIVVQKNNHSEAIPTDLLSKYLENGWEKVI